MLSSPTSFIFYAIFAVILVVTYLAIRREWATTGIVAGLSVVGSVIAMLLVSLSQGNTMFQAIIVSLGIGTVFSLATDSYGFVLPHQRNAGTACSRRFIWRP